MEPVAFVLNADYPQRTTFLQFPGKTACFSGHREDALPLGETVVGYAATDLLKTLLAGCIEQAVQDGYRYFLDGLAEGVDLWAADDLIYRKQHGTEVLHLIAVEPCLHYLESRRSGREAMLHYVEHCEAVITIPYQGKFSFLRRNDYMLEHSWRLICVIHKTSGGTAYTLKRAIQKRKEIACISMENRDLLFQFAMHFLETGEKVPQTAAERFAYYHGHPERLRLCQSLLKRYAKW